MSRVWALVYSRDLVAALGIDPIHDRTVAGCIVEDPIDVPRGVRLPDLATGFPDQVVEIVVRTLGRARGAEAGGGQHRDHQ